MKEIQDLAMEKKILLTFIIISVILLPSAQGYREVFTCIDDPLFPYCLSSQGIDCNWIYGGSDSDFCDDAFGGGGGSGENYWVDAGSYLYPNATYASNVRIFGYIYAHDWSNVSITESQISDLSHTVDTDTNASTACSGSNVYLSGDGTCETDQTGGGGNPFDQSLNTTDSVVFYGLNITSYMLSNDWSNVSITESQISDLVHTTDTNCSVDGSCSLITYDSETSGWDKNEGDDFDGYFSSLDFTGTTGMSDLVDNDTWYLDTDTNASTACSTVNEFLSGIGSCVDTSSWDTNSGDDFDGLFTSLNFAGTTGFSDLVDNDTWYADTNCSAEGSCGLITYDSETTGWDLDPSDDFTHINNFTGSKTDTKICTWDATGGIINCTYTDQTGGGGGGGNPFDQSLNTTDDVTFNSITVDDNVTYNGGIEIYGTAGEINIGQGTSASGSNAITIGRSSYANALNSIIIGYSGDVQATANYGIGIGYSAYVGDDYQIVIGSEAEAYGGDLHAIAIGNSATCQATDGIAIGRDADSNADCLALGRDSNCEEDDLLNSSYANNLFENVNVSDTLYLGSYAQSHNILYRNNGTVKSFSVPAGTDSWIRQKAGTGELYHQYAVPTPGITAVLIDDDTTSGQDMTWTTNDQAFFRDSAIYINSQSDGDLDLTADTQINMRSGTINMQGNLHFTGDYELRVENGKNFACADNYPNACIEFYVAQGDSGYRLKNTAGAKAWQFNIDGNATSKDGGIVLLGNITASDRVGGFPGNSLAVSNLFYEYAEAFSPHYFDINPDTNRTDICIIDDEGDMVNLYVKNAKWKLEKHDPVCIEKRDKQIADDELWNNYTMDKEDCLANYQGSQKNEYEYVDFPTYKKGFRDCNFIIQVADENCKELNWTWYFEPQTSQCEVDEELVCLTSANWNFWYNDTCYANPKVECDVATYYINHTWNYNNMNCDFDPEKECYNRGWGWYWEEFSLSCKYDQELYWQQAQEECEGRGLEWIWNGNTKTCEPAIWW